MVVELGYRLRATGPIRSWLKEPGCGPAHKRPKTDDRRPTTDDRRPTTDDGRPKTED
jgi:hypothetical protein